MNAQLQKDLAANGVQAPSDITKALIESSDGQEPSGNGFFGKYLKKHIDLKKAAEAKIALQQKEEKERIEEMKREMAEKIKPDAQVVMPSGTVKPKKYHKMSLSERAEAKLKKEEEAKAD